MANIFDYLDWRGDVPFSVDPFNEVDNLVLCELVYTAFGGIVPGPDLKRKISIERVCDEFFTLHTEEELMKKTTMTKLAPLLLKKMAHSGRFGGTKLAGYVNEVDPEDKSQFAVCTFYLPDGSIYVAFRGTDDSLIGWREDFDMSFSPGTGGQLKAVDYLNKNFTRTMKGIRVGGHSKGGNFAVYASAFCRLSVKNNITQVYCNDGPGFIQEIVNSDKYESIVDRVISIIPQQSIVGLLMNNNFNSKVIVSDAKGINQHDPLSWQLLKNSFIEAEGLEESALVLEEIIKKWVVEYDYETRVLFGDIIFAAMESSGAKKLSQVTGGGIKSLTDILKKVQSLDEEKQAVFYDVVKNLISTGGGVYKNVIFEKIMPNSKNKKK